MSDEKNGGPAFPCDARIMVDENNAVFSTPSTSGMTLRDYFAIHASYDELEPYRRQYESQVVEKRHDGMSHLVTRTMKTSTAEARYAFADAMLAARQA